MGARSSGYWLSKGGSLALNKWVLMLLLVRGANMGVDLTLLERLFILLILGQYFLMIWVAFRVVGVYLAENTVLEEAFLTVALLSSRSLSFVFCW